ncbi:MAG: glycoside hydrolase family 32 protein [Bacteroidales bacterium]
MKYILLFSLVAFSASTVRAEKTDKPASRTIRAEERYLNFPVRTGAKSERIEIFNKGKKVRELLVELDGDNPEFWVNLDINEWKGSKIEVRTGSSDMESHLQELCQSNSPVGKEGFYKEPLRPGYHFTSARGWFNDPNGMMYQDGKWHLFYQHNPYGWGWNNMTWGHAISDNLTSWTEVGDALHPDARGTIFSGSGIVDKNNVLGLQQGDVETLVVYFTYAGNTGHKWSEKEKMTQGMAYSVDNGKTWVKYAGNPVVDNIYADDRDPKVVWDEAGNQWVMSLYLGDQHPEHAYVLLTSKNLIDWKEAQRFSIEEERECPDLFPMKVEGSNQSKWVFTGANSIYVVGDFKNDRFTPATPTDRIDIGNNYYAAQTFSNAPGNKVVQMGWMRDCNFPGMPFNQQMSFPREMKLFQTESGYKIKSMPVASLSDLFTAGCFRVGKQVLTNQDDPTRAFCGDMYVLDATFDTKDSEGDGFGFSLDGFEVYYSMRNNDLTIGLPGGNRKTVPLSPENGEIKFRILVDVGSVEVFANDGLVAGAFAYLPATRTNRIRTIVHGQKIVLDSLSIHEIKSTWR